MSYLRGNVYFTNITGEEKPYLVISNNRRNSQLKSALAVRITTSRKPAMDSIVPIPAGEAVVGSILCDDIETLYDDDNSRHGGALTVATMRAVAQGLRVALALS